jgi:hypothetical protein
VHPFGETIRVLAIRRWLKNDVILSVLRQTGLRLVKRRQALVETNLSRNSQLETHRSDELGSRPKSTPSTLSEAGLCAVSKIDGFPHTWKNSSLARSIQSAVLRRLQILRAFCIPAPSGVLSKY